MEGPTETSSLSVLLVGHGSERHPIAAETLAAHADALRTLGGFAAVRHAMLAGGPDPAEQFDALPTERIVVLPFFMSDGYFVRQALPERLRLKDPARRARALVSSPVGTSAHLSGLLADTAEQTAADSGWETEETELVVVGHGSSNDPASRRATEWQAARMPASFVRVRTAFLEEPPLLDALVGDLTEAAVILGFFAADAGHAAEDVPRALSHAPVATAYSGAIGAHPAMPDILLALVDDALSESSD